MARSKIINQVEMKFLSRSVNEGFARVVASAFASQTDPTIELISEIKTAVSEAVTNAVVHGYQNTSGIITIKMQLFEDKKLRITVKDKGIGIPDIDKAMTPLYTTGNEDRAGMGFTIMETFTDKLKVKSRSGKGTTVIMEKKLT